MQVWLVFSAGKMLLKMYLQIACILNSMVNQISIFYQNKKQLTAIHTLIVFNDQNIYAKLNTTLDAACHVQCRLYELSDGLVGKAFDLLKFDCI